MERVDQRTFQELNDLSERYKLDVVVRELHAAVTFLECVTDNTFGLYLSCFDGALVCMKETLELMCFDKKSRLRGPSIAGRVHVHRNCALGEDGMEEINKLTLVWKGLPADEHKKANGFWYIQNAKSDDLQPPLAILLSRSPPWTWHAPWWLGLPGPEQRFRSEPSLAVRLDSVSPSEEANLRKSLSTVERPEKLLEVTESLAAQKLLRRAEEAKAAEKVQCFRREEEQSDWQQAAAIFDATAAQLCQILQELQGADAALRRRLLTKKRRLESDEEFIAAVKRLE